MKPPTLKCPQCQMGKFRKTITQIKFDKLTVVAMVCATCGNVMFNANDITKLQAKKVKGSKLTK